MRDVPSPVADCQIRTAKYHAHPHVEIKSLRIRFDIKQISFHRTAAVQVYNCRYERHFDAWIAPIYDGVVVESSAFGQSERVHIATRTASTTVLT